MGNRRIFLSKFSNFIFLHLRETYGSILSRGRRPVKIVCSHISMASFRTLLMTSFLPNAKYTYSPILFTCIIIQYNQYKFYLRKVSFLPKKQTTIVQLYNYFKEEEEGKGEEENKHPAFFVTIFCYTNLQVVLKMIIRCIYLIICIQIVSSLVVSTFSNLISFSAIQIYCFLLLPLPDFSITHICLQNVPVILPPRT